MVDDHYKPMWKTFTFRTHMTSNDKTVEVMQLLAQVMESYPDLTPEERNTVAEWFHARNQTPPQVSGTT